MTRGPGPWHAESPGPVRANVRLPPITYRRLTVETSETSIEMLERTGHTQPESGMALWAAVRPTFLASVLRRRT